MCGNILCTSIWIWQDCVLDTSSSEEEEIESERDVTLPSWEDVLKLNRLSNLDTDLKASGWKGVVNGIRSKDTQLG